MKICKDCLVPMVGIMSFSREKREKFNKCPKCHDETRHRNIKDSELSFGEVLHREFQKRNK